MKAKPKIGITGEQRFVVEARHAIDFADETMPPVLATPWLVWFLEHAARAAVLPLLSAGESTVGIEIEVEHTAPTPVGQSVVCQARVIHVEGATVAFQLAAWDEQERIARGFHKLQVIQAARFARRVRRKERPART